MGQVIPRGQPFIRYEQVGGGVNCDWSRARFEYFYDQRLAQFGITEQDLKAKMELVNAIFGKYYPDLRIVLGSTIVIFIVFCSLQLAMMGEEGYVETTILPVIVLIGIYVSYALWARNKIESGIQTILEDWKAKGIAITRIPKSKENIGALYLTLPNPNFPLNQGTLQLAGGVQMMPLRGAHVRITGQPLVSAQTGAIAQPLGAAKAGVPGQPIGGTQMEAPDQPAVVVRAMQSMTVVVPPGAVGGQMLQLDVNGRMAQIQIPQGLQEGMQFQVQV